jgi:CelD/BcsL family acetyltransferase involved in cellulose biosynthesis
MRQANRKRVVRVGGLITAFMAVAWFSELALAVVKPSTKGAEEPEAPAAATAPSPGAGMSLSAMDQLIRQVDPKAQRDGGSWTLQIQNVPLTVVTDERADRMRILCPVARTNEVTEIQYLRAMEANFHTALDARYATSHGILFSVFIHRLSTLDAQDFLSGAEQVAHLAAGFGTSYSSGVMRFGQ